MTNHIMSILRVLGNDERRKARNLLLKPALQLKLPLYIMVLTATFVLMAMWVGFIYFEQLYVMMVDNSTYGDYLQETIRQQTTNFVEASASILFAYFVVVVVVSMIYTHRLIGPTVAIARHIKALKEGRYGHRVHLRKHDSLKDLAAELNDLAEKLEQNNRQVTD